MILYPPATGTSLNADQISELDDSFFSSRPVTYFRARLDELLDESVRNVDYTDGLASGVSALIGDPRILESSRPPVRDRTTRRAVDCFTLRHHLAEVIVRLFAALWHAEDARNEGSVSSVWWELANGATTLDADIDLVRGVDVGQEGVRVAGMLGYPGPAITPATESELQDLLGAAWDWIVHATALFRGDGPDQNGAHNKLKHGFATLPADDLRLSLIRQPPSADGTLPLSALRDEIPVIDGVALVFLSKYPRPQARNGTIEVTALTLDPSYLLAESVLLWRVYAALFATAATRQFAGRSVEGLEQHRGLFAAPSPREFMRRQPPGLRETLAYSASGNPPPRGSAFFAAGYIFPIKISGPPTRGVVVDDGEKP